MVSYKTTKADIVLLPVEKLHDVDISKLNEQIRDIFAPCGVEISITESDALVGNTGWDLNGDGKLSLTNDAETDNVKRSAEMKALENIVKSMPGYDKNALYLVYVPKGSKSADVDVEGNWGRGRQIGYVFEKLEVRTVAHEVGHAFTLQHTFDRQYGGNETRCKTENLMDYTKGIQLDAFQWEILAHNAPKIVASVVDGAEDNWFAGKIIVTPNLEFTTIPGTATLVASQEFKGELKTGTLPGFQLGEKFYVWHDGHYVDKNGGTVYDYKEIEPSTLKAKECSFMLFYNLDHECGTKCYIDVPNTEDNNQNAGLIKIIENAKIDKKKAEMQLFEFVYKLADKAFSKIIPCVTYSEDENTAKPDYAPLSCESGNIPVLLQPALDEIKNITSETAPSETNKILEENYSSCLFESIPIDNRIAILNSLLSEETDDEYWEFSDKWGFQDKFYLDKLILATPEKDRLKLLKDGFMANNYRWLRVLFEKSSGAFFNNDVVVTDLVELVSELGGWVNKNFDKLNVDISEYRITLWGKEYRYPFASLTPICIGDTDEESSFYKDVRIFDGRNYYYDFYIEENPIVAFANDGRITFEQKFKGIITGQYLIEQNSDSYFPTKVDGDKKILTVNPFEPVTLVSNRDVLSLGLNAMNEVCVPAFVAAFYAQKFYDADRDKTVRHFGNRTALALALISAPFTSGGTWGAYLGYVSSATALADDVYFIKIR